MAKDIMHRKAPVGVRPGRREPDIKKAYTTKQLSGIGAVALIWNECDHLIHWTLKAALNLPDQLWLDVTTRLNGLDARLAILSRLLSASLIIPDNVKNMMGTVYADMPLFSKYRNYIVHALTFDPDLAIGLSIGQQAKFMHILLSDEALTGFYDRLVFFREELRCAEAFFRIAVWEAERILAFNTAGLIYDPRALQSAQEFPALTALLQDHQRSRRLLPPLPRFPDEDLAHPKKEAPIPHPDFEERD